MKRNLLITCAAITLAACSQQDTSSSSTGSAQSSASNAAKTASSAANSGSPELGSFGVTLADIDENIKPGDDFFEHVGGKWIKTFEIPSDRSSYGSFTVLAERSETRVRKIIEDSTSSNAASGSVEQKIGDYFASFTDTDTIETKGLKPLEADLAYLSGLKTKEDVAKAFARPDLRAASPIGAFVNIDSKRPDQYSVFLTQSGLGMPNRSYYLEEKFADKKELYKAYIAEVLTMAGMDNAEERANAIFAMEESIATAHWTPAKRRNRSLTYNLMSSDQLREYASGFPWDAFFESNGLNGQSEFILREVDAIQAIAQIIDQTPVNVMSDYLQFHLLRSNSAILPKHFDEANFAYYGTSLRGTPQQRERWKRGVAAVNGALGEAVGQVYVERHFPEDSKTKMDDLVKNLRLALDERLDTLPWMGEQTKVEAHDKLNKFTPKVGYPDAWQDYSALEVIRGDAYGNGKRAGVFRWNVSINRLGGPIDQNEWGMTPQTVNAYYSPPRNEIVFPAAILQAPFFDPYADAAVNYGGIGAVIGHEIGHGFDDQGSKSDGDGRLREWWTPEDRANFEKLTEKLGAQYGSYAPFPGFNVKPQLTMGENIGDVGGLAMAYRAYKLSLNGKEDRIINGYTGDQRFFLAWAQVWKRKDRDDALKNQIETDPHSPARYRVNGVVRNMDAWYAAFDVKEGDALYLAPEDRVQIW